MNSTIKSLHPTFMKCRLECNVDNTIKHVFKCEKFNYYSLKTNVSLSLMFASVREQKEAVSLFTQKETIRIALL